MQRELKFRAYSLKSHKIIYGYPVILKGKLDCFVEDITGSHWGIESWEVKVMQFTGLTDKNGKDIYHGDIIDTPQRGIEVVEIDQEYDMIGYHECWERSGIILGNIHEHPELLEQQP